MDVFFDCSVEKNKTLQNKLKHFFLLLSRQLLDFGKYLFIIDTRL